MNKTITLTITTLLLACLTSCGAVYSSSSFECDHSVVVDKGFEPTCIGYGLTDGSHCEKCGKIITPQVKIEPKGHIPSKDEAVEPSYTHSGLTEGSHCSVCGAIIDKQEKVDKLDYLRVEYSVDHDKGYLIGNNRQDVELNEETEEVEVRGLPGYRFVGWSDGNKDQKRKDTITEDVIFEAQFEKTYRLDVLSNNKDYGNIEGETTQDLSKGELSSPVVAKPNLGYKFKSWSNDSKEAEQILTIDENTNLQAIFDIDYKELPVMEIRTANRTGIVSKDNYVGCGVSVSNADFVYEFDDFPAKIKGRGNSTWNMPKKPYKLKFDKKINLFGNGEAKTWTLIANYCDQSLGRNYLAYQLGALLGSDYCTTTQFIDLYVNGEYQGVYLVCEQNEVGKTRVNIDESYDNVNTGYLLELDARVKDEGEENKDWFYFNGMPYGIKSPDTENEAFDVNNVDFIKTYLTNAYQAIISGDYDAVIAYIDLNSFAHSYIVHEIMKTVDVGNTSFYIFKNKDGLLKAGPLWDFDISSGNCDYAEMGHDVLWAYSENPWYKALLDNINEFRQRVSNYLENNYASILDCINDSLNYMLERSNSFNRNFEKWEILGQYVWPNGPEIVEITTWEGQVEYLHEWVTNSLNYIYSQYVSE